MGGAHRADDPGDLVVHGPCEDRTDPGSWDDPDIAGPWRPAPADDADALDVLDLEGWITDAPPDVAPRLAAPRAATGRYLDDLPAVIRSAGLVCHEDPGARGRNHGPMTAVVAVVMHHTGSSGSGAWTVVRDGRPGLAGPLAQLTIERDGSVRWLANGVSWHAGTGTWPSIGRNNANSRAIGIEAVYNGSDITDAQRRTYLLLVVALVRHYQVPVANVIGHREWAVGRKVDPGRIDLPAFRRDVTAALRSAPTPGTAAGGVYVVVSGDTLWGIAQRYGTTVDGLRAVNGLVGDALSVGQRLTVPGGAPTTAVHTVVSGDTLWGIARDYGTTVDALRAANGLVGDALSVGQVVAVPARPAAPTPKPAAPSAPAPPAPAPDPAPAPVPTPPAPAGSTAVDVLAGFGMTGPEHIVATAARLGLALPVAAAFLEQETTTARNVWGHDRVDPDGLYTPGAPVTRAGYEAYAARRKHQDVAGPGEVDTQGVGPMQITHWSLQDECDRLHGPDGGTWRWEDNVDYGLGLVARYLRTEGTVWAAARRYNGKTTYADALAAKVAAWVERLAGVVPAAPPRSEVAELRDLVGALAARLDAHIAATGGGS